MAVNSVQFVFLVVCLSVSWTRAEDENTRAASLVQQNIDQVCFGCICQAASDCDTSSGCVGEVCGPFRITWAYWADSGKPTLNNEPPTNDGAWTRCVNDAVCASRAVQGYMNKYAQDCNGDGVINCDDYVRIHRFGGYGCSAPLDPKYENVYRSCMAVFG
ncbi:invertebrate-type lysozyme 3-like [Venturia canescens]|uniref:invertebrate-type lysozyme 3-like n=1 Tax=Venturia canescens TaxID=32260 RepID=UPI001C9D26B3|nr:invertebrate-type lysozyme 3-like [Venturia canescens]